jgi:hypothetical protein
MSRKRKPRTILPYHVLYHGPLFYIPNEGNIYVHPIAPETLKSQLREQAEGRSARLIESDALKEMKWDETEH